MTIESKVDITYLGEGSLCPTRAWPLVESNCVEEFLQLGGTLCTSSQLCATLKDKCSYDRPSCDFCYIFNCNIVCKWVENNSILMLDVVY